MPEAARLPVEKQIEGLEHEVSELRSRIEVRRADTMRGAALLLLVLSLVMPRLVVLGERSDDPERSYTPLGLLTGFPEFEDDTSRTSLAQWLITWGTVALLLATIAAFVLLPRAAGWPVGGAERGVRISLGLAAGVILLASIALIGVIVVPDTFNVWQPGLVLSGAAAVLMFRLAGSD